MAPLDGAFHQPPFWHLDAVRGPSTPSFELKATVAFRRRGVATKLVLPGRAEPHHSAKCDPTLIKAIARGRLWFEELTTGRARSLHELATREGITRRYIRRLGQPRFSEPTARRGDRAGPAADRAHRNAAHRTRPAARLERAAQAARKLIVKSPEGVAGRGRDRGPRVVAESEASSQVGLHQWPTEKRSQGGPDRGWRVRLSRPHSRAHWGRKRRFSPAAAKSTRRERLSAGGRSHERTRLCSTSPSGFRRSSCQPGGWGQ